MAELVPFNSVRIFLGLPDNETDSETIILQMLASQVTDRFYTYVGYPLLTGTATEIKDIDGKALFLDRKPLQSISSLRFSYYYDWDNESEVDTDDYYVDYSNAIIYFKTYNPYPRKDYVRVTYTAGYTTSNLPDSIRRAYMAQLRHEWMNKNQFGHASITTRDGASVDVIGFDLLPDVKHTLEQYRRLA